MGMPVADFVDAAYTGISEGGDQIIIGKLGPMEGYDEARFKDIIDTRVTGFKWLSGFFSGRR